MARFVDIMRADELKAAKDKFDIWLKLDQAAKKAAYATAVGDHKRVNRSSETTFIQPFGAPDNFWYETKGLAPSTATQAPTAKEENDAALITLVRTAVAPYINSAIPTGANNMSNRAQNIGFSKVKCTQRTGAGVAQISRFTGRSYTKYQTNTISSPFGYANGSTDKTEQAAARAIRLALIPVGANPPEGRTVGFSPQGNVGNIVRAAA